MYRLTDKFLADELNVGNKKRDQIEKQQLSHSDKFSAFYVAETDEEREANASSMSQDELSKAAKAIAGRATYTLKLTGAGWFRNIIPPPAEWQKSHPMVLEVLACLKPIKESGLTIKSSVLQSDLQERGAFLAAVQPGERYKAESRLRPPCGLMQCHYVLYTK